MHLNAHIIKHIQESHDQDLDKEYRGRNRLSIQVEENNRFTSAINLGEQ